MDKVDKQILDILQSDGKITNQDLADKVSLSPSPCLRRVKQLEDEGYIKKYVALLDQEKIGLSLSIIVLICLSSHDPKILKGFEKAIEAIPEVVNCYMIAGQTADYMLKIIVPNLNVYQDLLINKLTRIEGVNTLHSSFVLRTIIDKTSLPLKHLKN